MSYPENPLLNTQVTCKECGMLEELHWDTKTNEKMNRLSLCFHCNFWQEYVEQKDNPRYHRIKGTHYVVSPETNGPDNWKGYSGRKFIIKRGEEIITTTNLWCQGTIPDHFKDRLPDTSEFLTV
jgi:hypothetical protein